MRTALALLLVAAALLAGSAPARGQSAAKASVSVPESLTVVRR